MNHRTKFMRAYCYYRKSGKLNHEYMESLMPSAALDKLTSNDLLFVMQSIEKAYCDGKNSPKE